MHTSCIHGVLRQADQHAADGKDIDDVLAVLRTLPLADFCSLHLSVPTAYPNLARCLPKMPSDDIQKRWVGDFGHSLMIRTCSFARLLQVLYAEITGKSLRGKRILDYGSGWGRLLRIMNYYSPPELVYGLDVMEESLAACVESGILNRVEMCSRKPQKSPFGDTTFDLIYSFSIFTHLPTQVMRPVLSVMRDSLSADGLLVITFRSLEFWELRRKQWGDETVDALIAAHRKDGYAFHAFDFDHDISQDYGDTTMSLEFFIAIAKEYGLEFRKIDRDLSEPYQIAACFQLSR